MTSLGKGQHPIGPFKIGQTFYVFLVRGKKRIVVMTTKKPAGAWKTVAHYDARAEVTGLQSDWRADHKNHIWLWVGGTARGFRLTFDVRSKNLSRRAPPDPFRVDPNYGGSYRDLSYYRRHR